MQYCLCIQVTLNDGYELDPLPEASIQPIQIIQVELPRCIAEEPLERVKQDCLCKGLEEEYQVRLAPMIEDKPLATYDKSPKAARHVKEQSQKWHLALQHSQSEGMDSERSTTPTGLFLSCEGKGDHLVISGKVTVVVKGGNPNVGNDTHKEADAMETGDVSYASYPCIAVHDRL